MPVSDRGEAAEPTQSSSREKHRAGDELVGEEPSRVRTAYLLAGVLSAEDEEKLASAVAELLAEQTGAVALIFGAAWAARALLVVKCFSSGAQALARQGLTSIAEPLGLPKELTAQASAISPTALVVGCSEGIRTKGEKQEWTWWSGRVEGARGLLAVAACDQVPPTGLRVWGETATRLVHGIWQLSYFRRAAYTDPLTGLANRRAFNQAVDRELRRLRRYGRPFSVVLIDLDNFRQVNHLLGHSGGDMVLREFAQWLGAQVRGADLVARVGGDEFALVCPETRAHQAQAILRRLAASAPQIALPGGLRLSLTGGVAEARAEDASPQDIYARADSRLWEGKQDRKGDTDS